MTIEFIEIYSDIGAGKHGTTHGVAMLSEHCETHYPSAPVHKIYAKHDKLAPAHPSAKYIENLLPFFKQTLVPQVGKRLQQMDGQSFPVIISGDHSNAIGNLAAFMNHHRDRRIGVVWIDAHADLHSALTTPSGNMHGMPLATALRLDNADCQINTLDETATDYWHKLKSLSSHDGILPSDVFFLGLRSFEPPEVHLIKTHQMFAYSAKGTPIAGGDRQSLDAILDAMIDRLAGLDAVYVSFDVDALDDTLIPATGTPEPDGYQADEVRRIFDRVLMLDNVKLFEITEFNPTLDDDSDKHRTIFGLLDHALALIHQRS